MTEPDQALETAGKSEDRRKPRHPDLAPITDMFAGDIINHFRLTGALVAADIRHSGATVITLQCGSLLDAPVGESEDHYTTSRFMVRIPPRLKPKFPDEIMRQPMALVTVTGRIQGFIDYYEGREYLSMELVANDIRFIARWGAVFMRPSKFYQPVIEREGSGLRDTQRMIRARLHGRIALDNRGKEVAEDDTGEPEDGGGAMPDPSETPAVAARPAGFGPDPEAEVETDVSANPAGKEGEAA